MSVFLLFLQFCVAFFFFSNLNAQTLTKLQWRDLGSKEVDFLDVDLKPMPLLHPGIASLKFVANFKRQLSEPLKSRINIIRTVSGLNLKINW